MGTLNRIYQGAVLKVGDGDDQLDGDRLRSTNDNPLWRHHELFQDAVNYYLLALGALAEASAESAAADDEGRLVRDLRERLGAAWKEFPRDTDPDLPGARSLRDSVAEHLGLKGNATLENAFEACLSGSESAAEARLLALQLLLSKCSGDAGVQQNGRGYLPRFVWSKNDPSWDFSPEAIEASRGAKRLSEEIHADETSQAELVGLAADMDLSWVVKVSPGKFYEGVEARDRLIEALKHTLDNLNDPSPRVAEVIEQNPGAVAGIESLREQVVALGVDELRIPRNRKANKDLTFSALLFQFFPSELTRSLLRLCIAKPKSSDTGDSKSVDFGKLGDDPIKLARGKRGYVFRAFTALKKWKAESDGEPVWKEFDIAAFKEALKSLNQFNQKTEEREVARQRLQARFDYMTGESSSWEAPKTSGEEEPEKQPPRLADDARYEKLVELQEELGADLEGDYGITRSALRGLRDIRAGWEQLPAAAGLEDFQNVVKDVQREHRDDIGSVPLFLALCEENWREVWQLSSEETNFGDHAAKDMLFAMCDLNDLKRDLERKKEPINLTPAEPVHSRRLFMFSDLAGSSDVKFLTPFSNPPRQRVEVSIAAEEDGGYREKRVVLEIGAKRLLRDQLAGAEDESSRWLQPMMEALELDAAPPEAKAFDSALALAPEIKRGSWMRMLVNFPVSLDAGWLVDALGKAERWKNQFNGIKDRALHLHWPGTATTEAAKRAPWHKRAGLAERGFSVLGFDFGQRTAGAWCLLDVSTSEPKPKSGRKPHWIGNDGTRDWFADVAHSGLTRLPGESAKVSWKGKLQTEFGRSKGRTATREEYNEARNLAREMGIDGDEAAPNGWIGKTHREKSFAEQNDALIRIARRRLSRLSTYHRWSCAKESEVKRLGRIRKELDAYEDHQDWAALIDGGEIEKFTTEAGAAFESLQDQLRQQLLKIADRAVPLRAKRWSWETRNPSGKDPWGRLVRIDDDSEAAKRRKIRAQRGISFRRIEQLEDLRRLFQRFNRSLGNSPGVPAKFGREAREQKVGEPCPDLLDKLDRIKAERVNLTAHLILAQALGLRLRGDKRDAKTRAASGIHGEYERIPGREPVDFIVIEDLERYRFSQGRAPSENSRLMKWSHRAVRDKLVMLCEPFGIPVLEVPPGYSSKICSETSRPGFRAVEVGPGETNKLGRVAEDNLDKLEAQLQQLPKPRPGEHPRRLIAPRPGGPLFIAVGKENGEIVGGPIRQADVNASINVALRAIAAPECFRVHSKIRTEPKDGSLTPIRNNKREKAAFDAKTKITALDSLPEDMLKQSTVNVFLDPDGVVGFDRIKVEGIDVPAATGRGVWSTINGSKKAGDLRPDLRWVICEKINEARVKKWGDNISR